MPLASRDNLLSRDALSEKSCGTYYEDRSVFEYPHRISDSPEREVATSITRMVRQMGGGRACSKSRYRRQEYRETLPNTCQQSVQIFAPDDTAYFNDECLPAS